MKTPLVAKHTYPLITFIPLLRRKENKGIRALFVHTACATKGIMTDRSQHLPQHPGEHLAVARTFRSIPEEHLAVARTFRSIPGEHLAAANPIN